MVAKISAEKRQELETSEAENQREAEQKVIQNMLGFTRVFKILKEHKKVKFNP